MFEVHAVYQTESVEDAQKLRDGLFDDDQSAALVRADVVDPQGQSDDKDG